MLLRNLNPSEGLYNETRMILLSWTPHVLRCCILRDGVDEARHDDNNTVLIPRMSLDASSEDNPIPLRCRQFPVRLAFTGQNVKWVGLNLRTPVFSHGQLYVALSHCTHPENEEGSKTTNVVYTKVLRGLTD
ncbi:hypothetical protein P692DRAFT_20754897 [Suillus brevipes Sb2]|nr:hypothetical protein P692DRAFT_20754897 [Suillus brevipes Sb2]